MFTPTAKIRKMIVNGQIDSGYIYRNGIVLRERKTVKLTKDQDTTVTITHVFPCEIYIDACDHGNSNNWATAKVNRIVLHDANLIAYGVRSVHVTLGNGSNATREKGISLTDVAITTSDGVRLSSRSVNNLTCGGAEPQPNTYQHYSSDGDANALEWVNRFDENPVLHDAQ